MADTPKFTPGPWRVELGGLRGVYRVTIPREHEALAAEHDGQDGSSVSSANAALIAAAPDLYEALKAFADHFGPLEDNYMLNDDCRRCFRLARDAFAKAEGRS